MKRETIGKLLFVVSFILIAGIVGSVELGTSIWNLLWCLPLIVTTWIGARLAGFID